MSQFSFKRNCPDLARKVSSIIHGLIKIYGKLPYSDVELARNIARYEKRREIDLIRTCRPTWVR